MRRILSIGVALWAGSLCTICGLAAPTLFATLDRSSAGQAAAALFRIQAWLGVVFAVIVLLTLRSMPTPTRATRVLVAITAGAPVLSELALGPMMTAARSANDMARFGMLHGIAAALFLVACAGSLLLLWRLSPRAE